MPSIQDLVAAVVGYTSERPGTANLVEIFGTAFFLDGEGIALTARSALEQPTAPGVQLGLAVRMVTSHAQTSIVPIASWETAQAPVDVTIFKVQVEVRPAFDLARVEAAPLLWERIGTYGCVGSDRPKSDRPPTPVFHALCGNVIREVPAQDDRAPASLELSFPIHARMRGAPLFVYERPRARLYGVCTGNREFDLRAVAPSAATPSAPDVVLRGVATDLRTLGAWQPRLLGGRTLRELFPTG